MMFASDQNVVVHMLGPQLWGFLGAAPPDNIETGYTDGINPAAVEFALIRPNGSQVAFTFGSPLPPEIATVTTDAFGLFRLVVLPSAFTDPGSYAIVASLGSPPNANYSRSIATWQWGGVADDIQLARKYLTNRIEADFTAPTAPVLTVYDDDDIAVLGTRTAQNANGSAVSQNQITNLSQLTP